MAGRPGRYAGLLTPAVSLAALPRRAGSGHARGQPGCSAPPSGGRARPRSAEVLTPGGRVPVGEPRLDRGPPRAIVEKTRLRAAGKAAERREGGGGPEGRALVEVAGRGPQGREG